MFFRGETQWQTLPYKPNSVVLWRGRILYFGYSTISVEFRANFRPVFCTWEKTCFHGYYCFLCPSAMDTLVITSLPFNKVDGTSTLYRSCATFDLVTLTGFQNFISTDFLTSISIKVVLARLACIYWIGKLTNVAWITSQRRPLF